MSILRLCRGVLVAAALAAGFAASTLHARDAARIVSATEAEDGATTCASWPRRWRSDRNLYHAVTRERFAAAVRSLGEAQADAGERPAEAARDAPALTASSRPESGPDLEG
jgi:hypothetical protein